MGRILCNLNNILYPNQKSHFRHRSKLGDFSFNRLVNAAKNNTENLYKRVGFRKAN